MNPRAGFTLIEIMVSMGIAILAVFASLAILAAQNSSFTHQSGYGSALAQAQLATDTIERAIRLTGTGIDPQMAFDFDFYTCALPGAPVTMTESANCAITRRDNNNAPDELVVAYRDPAYTVALPGLGDQRAGCSSGNATTYAGKVWGVIGPTSATSITLLLKPGDVIYRGQVLQIACSDGVSYTYATVSSPKQSVAATAAGCSSVTLSLYPNSAQDPFNQSGYLSSACFSATGPQSPRAYAVRRNRFFIHRDLVGPNPHTYLMLDQGLDINDDGTLTDADLVAVAADIEDLQFAYATEQPGILSLPTPPTGWAKATYVVDSNANGVWGDDPGAAAAEQLTEPVVAGSTNVPTTQFNAANLALGAGPQSCTGSTNNPFFRYPCILGTAPVEASKANDIHAYRWPAWPGNISQVLVGIVARAPVADSSDQITQDELQLPQLLNRPLAVSPAFPPWYGPTNPAGRKRVTLLTGVRPANIALARLFWN